MSTNSLECPKCHNADPDRFAAVVESTGYIHRKLGNDGAGHGSAVLKGWRCMNCGETKTLS